MYFWNISKHQIKKLHRRLNIFKRNWVTYPQFWDHKYIPSPKPLSLFIPHCHISGTAVDEARTSPLSPGREWGRTIACPDVRPRCSNTDSFHICGSVPLCALWGQWRGKRELGLIYSYWQQELCSLWGFRC